MRNLVGKLISAVCLAIAITVPAFAHETDCTPSFLSNSEFASDAADFEGGELGLSDLGETLEIDYMEPENKTQGDTMLIPLNPDSDEASILPSSPKTLADFEIVWDYAAANSLERIEFHYSERQSSNIYQNYRNILKIVGYYYRYLHPEDFNYMKVKDVAFVADEGSREGFTIVIEFADMSADTKREYRELAEEKARELYETKTQYLSPDLSQTQRARILCQAVADRVRYKNDSTNLCHTAYSALVNGYAVCDGYTSLLNMLLRMDGIECEGRIGTAGGGLHLWTYALLDGEWTNIDATWYDGGGFQYFGMTDEEISETHEAYTIYHDYLNNKAVISTAEASRF